MFKFKALKSLITVIFKTNRKLHENYFTSYLIYTLNMRIKDVLKVARSQTADIILLNSAIGITLENHFYDTIIDIIKIGFSRDRYSKLQALVIINFTPFFFFFFTFVVYFFIYKNHEQYNIVYCQI